MLYVKGARSVQIVEEIGDAKQRFATLQVTGRAANPQNVAILLHDLCKSNLAWNFFLVL